MCKIAKKKVVFCVKIAVEILRNILTFFMKRCIMEIERKSYFIKRLKESCLRVKRLCSLCFFGGKGNGFFNKN